MSILRLSTVALTLVLFTIGALILPVNTALAHCKGKHLTDPGPPDCNDPHGGGDPEPTTAFLVVVDLVDLVVDDTVVVGGGGVMVTEVKIKGNRQGLNGTMAGPDLTVLTACNTPISLGVPALAQFSISTAKIPPSSSELTYVEANIYDFTLSSTDDARVTLSFIPNEPLTFNDRLFPSTDEPNVLVGIEIGVSVSPDHDTCSGTINQDWTITVTKD